MSLAEETAAPHLPVLLDEVLEALAPVAGGRFVDGTFGAGGYTRALLDRGAARVLGIDRDPTAIAAGEALVAQSGGRLVLAHGRFGTLDRLAAEKGIAAPDGVVLDVGVSSMQLDRPERGFSFRAMGPLDMRMSLEGPTAADLVNTAEPRALAQIIGTLGEERRAGAIARAIVKRREREPFRTTRELAELVESVLGPNRGAGRGKAIHPATRTFQALRIFVNE